MPSTQLETQSNKPAGNLVPFDGWLHEMGKTRITGFRYRRQGLISVINIFGRLYVTREEIAAFERRAIAGEFHKDSKTPARRELVAA